MSQNNGNIKPAVETAAVLALLQETFNQPVQKLTPVGGGVIAQTLSFEVQGKEYILRFNPGSFDVTFLKEAFVYEQFASPAVPIPPILKVGQLGEFSYAISQKMPGRGLESLAAHEYTQILPRLLGTLYAIHTTNVQNWSQFGWIRDNGDGMFPSWKGFIARVMDEERPDGFYGKWHSLFQTTFLERGFFETVYARLLDLLAYCPEERWLVHSEYGYNNILVHDGEITAVLDWTDAMYGDFVYDVAVMDFWPPHGIDFPKLVYEDYTSRGMPLPNFQERVTCYKCYFGLDALRFFAKTNNYDAYGSTHRNLEKLLV